MTDANANALERMKAKGDDLTRLRDVDFTVVFSSEASAQQFADHFLALGHRVSVEFAETVDALPWDVVVVKHMALSQEAVERFEKTLQAVAIGLNGRNDGWGCFSDSSTT